MSRDNDLSHKTKRDFEAFRYIYIVDPKNENKAILLHQVQVSLCVNSKANSTTPQVFRLVLHGGIIVCCGIPQAAA